MEPCIGQLLVGGTEGSYRVVLGGVVHLAALNMKVAFGERAIIGSLGRCLICAAHCLEGVVHHIANTAVVGI